MNGTYFVAPDYFGDETLWRQTGKGVVALVSRPELDALDAVLWPALVRSLVGEEVTG